MSSVVIVATPSPSSAPTQTIDGLGQSVTSSGGFAKSTMLIIAAVIAISSVSLISFGIYVWYRRHFAAASIAPADPLEKMASLRALAAQQIIARSKSGYRLDSFVSARGEEADDDEMEDPKLFRMHSLVM